MRRQSGGEYDHHAGIAFLNSGFDFDKFIEYDEHRGAEAYSSTNDYSIEIIDIKPCELPATEIRPQSGLQGSATVLTA